MDGLAWYRGMPRDREEGSWAGQQASKTTPVGRSTRQGVEEVWVEALALAGGGLESQDGGFLD